MSSAQAQKIVKTAKTATKKAEVAKPVDTKVEEVKPKVEEAKPVEVKSSETKTEVKEKKPRVRKAKENADGKPVERKVISPESVARDMEELIGFVSGALADQEVLKKPAKVLRGVMSRVRHVSADVARLMKKGVKSSAPKNTNKSTNSGLMKPVQISADLAKFMGVASDSQHSRVAVTNAICSYIKEKNLQNPENKREIRPDENLASLLGYKGDKTAQPLTYFYIQQLIQPHFVKPVVA